MKRATPHLAPFVASPDAALSRPEAHTSDKPVLQLTVIKSVPPIGWALLFYALLASHSAGAVINIQAATAQSTEKHVFLRCALRSPPQPSARHGHHAPPEAERARRVERSHVQVHVAPSMTFHDLPWS